MDANDKESAIKKLEQEFESKLSQKENQLAEKENEIKNLIRESSQVKDQLRDKLRELDEATDKIRLLEIENKTQKNTIEQLNDWNDSKAHELLEKDKTIEIKTKLIGELEDQVKELNQKIESITHPPIETECSSEKEAEQELPTISKVQQTEIETKSVMKKPKEEVIYLQFVENKFTRVKKMPSSGISLIFDPKEMKWLLTWSSDAGFVQRKTAERQARSIANAGYSLESGGRAGQGFPLEIVGEESIPTRLLRDQHEY